MKTSSFSRSGSHPRAVAISRTRPKGWTGRVYEPLAPSWSLLAEALSGEIDEDEYIRRYREEVLASLDPARVYADLGEDAVLLCWERAGAFCHRRLVAEWFEEELGVLVPEVAEEGGGGPMQMRLDGYLLRPPKEVK
ncbi:MAG: hypothetical protein METHAR1v1_1640007 [Methanothrix sp.]|jgi:hypothetical protein|nr:MAG: hypothetical protein METHAR1v1_1640007 [Methanothrix sp.]